MIYKIVDLNNNTIGYSENLLYIKLNKFGCKEYCSKEDAIGIIYDDKTYTLYCKKHLRNTIEVIIKESSLSEILNMIKTNQALIDYISMETGVDIPL